MTAALPLSDPDLPRMLYFAGVPVENHMHGSALMYRLLESYPADKLLIVESFSASQPGRRLPGVDYRHVRKPIHRLLASRLARWLEGPYLLSGGDGEASLARVVGDFAPQAVLTVVHGAQWQTAAAYARRRNLPLHLIAHDQWRLAIGGEPRLADRVAPTFRRIYREAASRFCVSPRMVEVYERDTGVSAQVLYPSRRRGFDAPDTLSPRAEKPGAPFTAAYAGSIPDPTLIQGLELARSALQERGGRLIIFGPYSTESLASRGLAGENLVVAGPVHPHDLAKRLREEADVLLASVSFDPTLAEALSMNFPSKLTDYTAAGAPIMVHGPSDSSAGQWVHANPGVALLVDRLDRSAILDGIDRLIAEPQLRRSLAAEALRIGARQFSAESAEQTLMSAIRGVAA